MSVILHLFRWYVREHRLGCLLFLGALAIATINPWFPPHEWRQAIGSIALVAGAVFGVRVVLALNEKLPYVSSDTFWLSRPISRGQIGIAQLGVIVIFIALPILLANLLTLTLFDGQMAHFALGLKIWFALLGIILFLFTASVISNGTARALTLVGATTMIFFLILILAAYLSKNQKIFGDEMTVLSLLSVCGIGAVILIFLPPFHWEAKRAAYLSVGGVLVLGLFALGSHKVPPTSGEALGFQAELMPQAPISGDSSIESYHHFTHLTGPLSDEILQPDIAKLTLPGADQLVLRYPGNRFDHDPEFDKRLVADLILRHLPNGAQLISTFPPQDLTSLDFIQYVFTAENRSAHRREFEIKEPLIGELTARRFRLSKPSPMPLQVGKSTVGPGYRYQITSIREVRGNLSVRCSFTAAPRHTMKGEHGGRVAWVLHSPGAQVAVLTEIEDLRIPDEPGGAGVTMNGSGMKFPLPKTFTSHDDLELHLYLFFPEEKVTLPLKVHPGSYSLIKRS